MTFELEEILEKQTKNQTAVQILYNTLQFYKENIALAVTSLETHVYYIDLSHKDVNLKKLLDVSFNFLFKSNQSVFSFFPVPQ